MSSALSTCVLIVSLRQSVNGGQFLIITFLLALFAAAPAPGMCETVTVLLTSMYASL